MIAGAAGQKRSQFVRRLLSQNPDTNLKAANEAWRRAGNPGGISSSVFYKTKSEAVGSEPQRAANGFGQSRVAVQGPRVTAASGRNSTDPIRNVAEPRSLAGNGTESRSSLAGPQRSIAGERDSRLLNELEAQLDRLIFRAMEVGGLSEVEQTLRRARRQLIRSHRD